jgi:hypothetical protein
MSRKNCGTDRQRLIERLDKMWSAAIHLIWQEHCAVCHSRKALSPHHLVKRRHLWSRWLTENGILLCTVPWREPPPDLTEDELEEWHSQNQSCHDWAETHQDEFLAWLAEHYPDRYMWMLQAKQQMPDRPMHKSDMRKAEKALSAGLMKQSGIPPKRTTPPPLPGTSR